MDQGSRRPCCAIRCHQVMSHCPEDDLAARRAGSGQGTHFAAKPQPPSPQPPAPRPAASRAPAPPRYTLNRRSFTAVSWSVIAGLSVISRSRSLISSSSSSIRWPAPAQARARAGRDGPGRGAPIRAGGLRGGVRGWGDRPRSWATNIAGIGLLCYPPRHPRMAGMAKTAQNRHSQQRKHLT